MVAANIVDTFRAIVFIYDSLGGDSIGQPDGMRKVHILMAKVL